jgi:hypothetical protein
MISRALQRYGPANQDKEGIMAIQSTQPQTELFRARQQVQYSGEYLVLDEQGNPQGQDMITLDEGDTFPEVNGINACYQLNPTCLEEECEVLGDETPEVE